MSGAKLVSALVLLAASSAVAWRLADAPPPAVAAVAPLIPATLGPWRGRDRRVTERHYALLESRDVLERSYVDGDDEVLACVAVAGRNHKAAHPPEICYRGQGWQIVAIAEQKRTLAGRSRPLIALRAEKGGVELLVWSWYRVGGTETSSWWQEQLLAVAARLRRADEPAALLRFSTVIRAGDAAAAAARLARFADLFLPAAEAALYAGGAGGEAPPFATSETSEAQTTGR